MRPDHNVKQWPSLKMGEVLIIVDFSGSTFTLCRPPVFIF